MSFVYNHPVSIKLIAAIFGCTACKQVCFDKENTLFLKEWVRERGENLTGCKIIILPEVFIRSLNFRSLSFAGMTLVGWEWGKTIWKTLLRIVLD